MSQGAYEWGLEENEVGPHTFFVRAIDFEGNVGAPTTYTWGLLGVNVVFTDGPGFTPASGGPQGDPATGGPTASRSAEIHFEANVARRAVLVPLRQPRSGRATSRASRRSGPARPSPAAPSSRIRCCRATTCSRSSPSPRPWARRPSSSPRCTSGRSSSRSTPCRPRRRIERAPGAGRPELDDLRVLRHRRPDAGVPAHLRVPGHRPGRRRRTRTTGSSASARSTCSTSTRTPTRRCCSPAHVLRAGDRHVRARVPEPAATRASRATPIPTPASHTWTPVADTRGAGDHISGGPADGATSARSDEPYDVLRPRQRDAARSSSSSSAPPS